MKSCELVFKNICSQQQHQYPCETPIEIGLFVRPSVRRYACEDQRTVGWIFIKSDIGDFWGTGVELNTCLRSDRSASNAVRHRTAVATLQIKLQKSETIFLWDVAPYILADRFACLDVSAASQSTRRHKPEDRNLSAHRGRAF
jgi:hypothetical protein